MNHRTCRIACIVLVSLSVTVTRAQTPAVAGGWQPLFNGKDLQGGTPKITGYPLGQNFPVSIEVQFLGGRGTGERTTADLCTPGTHVVIGGQLIRQHCTNSTSGTYHGDQWVTVEIEVRGNQVIRHVVDGRTVLEYNQPQLDDQDPDAKKLLAKGAERMIGGGYISLQSESHPVEFRKVELKRLDSPPAK